MWDPRTTLHPNHNLNIAQNYLESLQKDSLSQLYFKGQQQFRNPASIFNVFKLPYFAHQLGEFYPYHPRVTEVVQEYRRSVDQAHREGALISAASIFVIFQAAKRGVVLPFLSKYGRYLGSHRVLRHYVWAAVLPTALLFAQAHLKHKDTITTYWAIHARRMQQKITSDPNGTRYPKQLLPIKLTSAWRTPYVDFWDQEEKLSNEVDLVDAPSYLNPEFEAVDLPEAEEEAEDEDEDAGENAGEDED